MRSANPMPDSETVMGCSMPFALTSICFPSLRIVSPTSRLVASEIRVWPPVVQDWMREAQVDLASTTPYLVRSDEPIFPHDHLAGVDTGRPFRSRADRPALLCSFTDAMASSIATPQATGALCIVLIARSERQRGRRLHRR